MIEVIRGAGRPQLDRTRLRVLHVLPWITPGGWGIQTYLSCVSAALAGSAVQIEAGALMHGAATSYVPQPRHLGRRGRSPTANAWSFWRWLWRDVVDMDIVQIHDIFGWPLVLGGLICLLRGRPYVVTPHGYLEPWSLRQKRAKKDLFLRLIGLPLLRRSAAVLATTEANAQSIRALDPALPVRVIVPGVPVRSTALDVGAPASALHVVYVGSFNDRKDLLTLIRALGLLRDRGAAAKLSLLGREEQPYTSRMRELIEDLRLHDAVTFCGFLRGESKDRVMAAAHVLALPSHVENFSFATAEAMGLGMPVVVTTGVALAEAVRRWNCGSVVTPGVPADLADALARYADPEVRRAQGRRAHECARRELSLEAMCHSLETLYLDAAAPR